MLANSQKSAGRGGPVYFGPPEQMVIVIQDTDRRSSPEGYLPKASARYTVCASCRCCLGYAGLATDRSATGVPSSACYNTKAICALLNFDVFMKLSVSRPDDHGWKIPVQNGPVNREHVTALAPRWALPLRPVQGLQRVSGGRLALLVDTPTTSADALSCCLVVLLRSCAWASLR